MRASAASWIVVLLVAAGCGASGGGGSTAASSSTTAASGAGSSSPQQGGGLQGGGPLDFSGVWQVTGTDAARGDYEGTATVTGSGGSYSIERLVTYRAATAAGRQVLSAWNATGTAQPAGLILHEALARANVVSRAGALARSPSDAVPLVFDALLAPPGGGQLGGIGIGTTIGATMPGGAGGATLTERWVLSSAPAPLFPAIDATMVPLHGTPSSTERSILWALFASFRSLPAVAPYAQRADFQAAIHSVPVDRTARDYYRASGANGIVIMDEVVDDISILEETWRADAFGHALHEKAAGFDLDMETNHVDASGMIANLAGPAPYRRVVSGDGALHTGSWVASQVYRYQATGDPQALANVALGAKGLATLVEISPDKTQFARAIDDAASAPASWTRGAGAYANLAWLPGGNNDMLHGIEYGFLAAEQVLPAGDPLRAEIGAAAWSLLQGVSIAQSGSHEVILASVAARTLQTAAAQARYSHALRNNFQDLAWTTAGDGVAQHQGIADWSGHHLAEVTFCCLRILGGASPDADEMLWRGAAFLGAKEGYHQMHAAREGLLSVIAAAEGAGGAADDARDILAEIPFPKPTGDATISRDVTAAFSVSPYPSDPWKGDWMSNPGRVQALTGIPLFYKGGDENYWARSPLETGGSVDAVVPTSQDFLHAYWLGRVTGVLGPND